MFAEIDRIIKGLIELAILLIILKLVENPLSALIIGVIAAIVFIHLMRE